MAMNREIKFRAWDKKAKCWVDDYFDDTYVYTLSFSGNIVYDLKPHKSKTPESMGWVLVEYTGLKDKNGVEIYEGDIVKAESYLKSGTFEVVFENGCFGCSGFILSNYRNNLEVIGNIYENKELLEQ